MMVVTYTGLVAMGVWGLLDVQKPGIIIPGKGGEWFGKFPFLGVIVGAHANTQCFDMKMLDDEHIFTTGVFKIWGYHIVHIGISFEAFCRRHKMLRCTDPDVIHTVVSL